MWSPRQRERVARLFGRRLILIGLIALLVGACLSVWNVYKKERESAILKVEAQLQLADLAGRQAKLNEDIEKLKTDRGMEEALRQQYALAAQGERLIVIVEPQKPQPIQATSTFMQRLRSALKWW